MQLIITTLSILYILFLPGFMLSLVFFKWGHIHLIERFGLSLALSLAVVPMVAFYGNLLGIPFTKINVLLEVTGILLLLGIVLIIQRERKKA